MSKLLMIVGLLAISHLASIGAQLPAGFSADSTIDISFPKTVYPIGSQPITATVTVSETNGRSGEVTVTGPGTINPSTFTLPESGNYQKSISVTLPTAPGTYTYTAQIGRIDGTTAQDSETITVYKVSTISVDKSEIAAGAINDVNHKCIFTITVTPVVSGAEVQFSITDNSYPTYADVQCQLSSTEASTNASGQCTVTLTSSNSETQSTAIVKAKAKSGDGTDEVSSTVTLLDAEQIEFTVE